MANTVDIDAAFRSIGANRSITLFGEEHFDIKELPYRIGIALNDIASLSSVDQDALVLKALHAVFGEERFATWEAREDWTQSHLQLLIAYILSGFKISGVQAAADRIVEGKNLPEEEKKDLTSLETTTLSMPISDENTELILTTPVTLPGLNSSTSLED